MRAFLPAPIAMIVSSEKALQPIAKRNLVVILCCTLHQIFAIKDDPLMRMSLYFPK